METSHFPIFSRSNLEELHHEYRKKQQDNQCVHDQNIPTLTTPDQRKILDTDEDFSTEEYMTRDHFDDGINTFPNNTNDMQNTKETIQNGNWHQLIESYVHHVIELQRLNKEKH